MERVRRLINYRCKETMTYKYRGQQVNVAIMDTGLAAHPDYASRVVNFVDCIDNWRKPYDDNGHGTHISGILGGDGYLSNQVYAGIAPEVRIHGIKVLDANGNGSVKYTLRGIDWILENQDKYKIKITNISVGTLPSYKDNEEMKLLKAVEELWDAGIVVVTAAGNYGPKSGSITIPGISEKVITVGAFDDQIYQNKYGGMQISYSGRGPTLECVCKPEIVAPGSYIKSCNSKRSYGNKKEAYTIKSGTSMATSVVSGAVALLLSKHRDMTNLEVKLMLKNTADDLQRARNVQGWGLLNVKKLLSEKIKSEH